MWHVVVYIISLALQILKAPCLLLSLFTSLNLCSGKFMTPITDDVSKLSLLVRLLSCCCCMHLEHHIHILAMSHSVCSPYWKLSFRATLLCYNTVSLPLISTEAEHPIWLWDSCSLHSQRSGKNERETAEMMTEGKLDSTYWTFFPGWHVLGGVKYLSFWAKPSEAGQHVWHHILQQRAHNRLYRHAEESALHLWPWGTGKNLTQIWLALQQMGVQRCLKLLPASFICMFVIAVESFFYCHSTLCSRFEFIKHILHEDFMQKTYQHVQTSAAALFWRAIFWRFTGCLAH